MAAIDVRNLKKIFVTYKKEPGFLGSVKSLVNRKYTKSHAVNDISFSIEQGELVGFLGPNGAGKTTTLKMLSGLLYPSRGEISVLGYTPFDKKPEFLKQISLVMGQKNQLWWDLPAYESFLLNKEIYDVSDKQFKDTIEELSVLLDVQDVLQTQVRKLSLGQRMKCELIAALLHRPKVVFLDEPTIGLDVIMQQKLRDFVKEYNKKFNATIILTSHYMQDVKELCDRIIIINHGSIIYDGNLSEIIKKYATHKIANVVFNKEVHKHDLEKLGEIKKFVYPEASIAIPLSTANEALSKLITQYPVEDITIEDISLEEIIRDIFSEANS